MACIKVNSYEDYMNNALIVLNQVFTIELSICSMLNKLFIAK